MHNDDDLRARFKSMADKESAATTFGPRWTAGAPPARRSSRWPLTVAASITCATITLGIGLVWGTNTGYASGRVDGDRQRAVIAANSAGASSQLAALRYEVARTRTELARGSTSAPTPSQRAAESELRSIEASIGRIEQDLASRGGLALAQSNSNPRSGPMKRALAVTCGALALGAQVVQPQSASPSQGGVPIIDLPTATVRSSVDFGGPIGVREVSGGKVMINDGRRRQIKLFDSTLSSFSLVSDSTPGTSIYYGPYGMQLIPYFGDSSLFGDFPSGTILVLNGRGDVGRAMAPPPDPSVMGSLLGQNQAGIDGKGHLIYGSSAGTMMAMNTDANGKSTLRITSPPDSTPIVRADMDARRIDTLARVRRARLGGQASVVPRPDGKGDMMKITLSPLRDPDEWAVLSDGTIGIVRGHDYHVDWIGPDGSRSATGKLPFDWKRLTDADKQKLIDSARAAENVDAVNAAAIAALSAPPAPPPDGGGGRGLRGGGGTPPQAGGRRGGRGSLLEIAPISEIPDFYPALRDGAALPDRDGNLWILPTTSAQSKNGELVYDVVNPKRGLFQRVRLPVGRSIVGFGPHGVVYLMDGDRATGFHVEKTRLP